jgi:lysophospholipase L1-like esterase
VGGYTTYHILPSEDAPVKDRPKPDNVHNITYALTLKPTAIIINLPTNDVARGYTLQEIMDNYARIVKIAAPIPVWITTSQPRNFGAVLNKRSMELKRLTEQAYGNYSIDFWTGLANEDGSIKREFNADNIHVNDQGHELLFKKVLQAQVTAMPYKVQ